MLQFFQDERASSLGHHKTVTFAVKGAAGFLGSRRVRRDSAHVAKGAHGQWRDHRFGPPGNHDIGRISTNDMKSFANGVRASSTGGDTAIIGPSSSKAHRDMSGSEIAEHHRWEEGRDPVGPFL